MTGIGEPPHDCERCDRLASFRADNRAAHADWFNAPVPSFGGDDARLLIVGLAPGLQGANRTGRPFTGDFAGDLLYATLSKFGFAKGAYVGRPDDDFELVDCMVTNAVRCVPPKNKPTGAEIANCRSFLEERIRSLPRLEVTLALGRIAHDSVLATYGLRKSAHPFSHGHRHDPVARFVLFDSYHCSRYNTNTGRLTAEMFEAVFVEIRRELGAD